MKRGLLLLALLTLLSCDEPEPLAFRYQIAAAPVTLDPGGTGDIYSSGIKQRLFDGLVRVDPQLGGPASDLAESWEVTEGGLVYTFRLLPNAVFHHGRPVRAEDVRASWQRVLAPGQDPETAFIFEPIDGVREYRSGAAEQIRGIEIIDPLTVRVRLVRKTPPFLYNLSHGAAAIFPVDEAERLGEAFARHPVGSGPFRFVSWDEDKITLAAFRDHPRPPVVDRLIYVVIADGDEALRRYQAGELDMVSTLPTGRLAALRQSYAEELHSVPGTSWFGFCFRGDRPPFHDARIRRAFALAIDRDALVRRLGETRFTASTSLLPQNTAGFDPALLSSGYDPEKARALLEEAEFDADDWPPITYTTRTGSLDAQVAQQIREDLKNLGLEIEVKTLEFGELLAARGRGELEFFRFGWGGEYPDPDSNLRPLFDSQGSDNRHGYSSAEVDRLLDAALQEEDLSRRLELTQRAERQILADAPCVGLYQLTDTILLKSRWIGIPINDPEQLQIELARLR